jgi:predicted metal-dependent phosphoesterase TrpH
MRRRGVGVLSITDHDTLEAYDGEPDMAAASGARIVRGVEINTTYRGNEVHVLGFGVRRGAEAFEAALASNRAARTERVAQIVRRLNAHGIPLAAEAVAAETRGSSVGRPHVAIALLRAGYVRSINAAFRTLLARGCPAYVPSLHMTPQQAIDLVAGAGGVCVLAHPGRLTDDGIVDELAESGLVGLEVFYPSHSPSQRSYFRGRARDLGLVMTAGSDFHDPRYNAAGVGIDVDEDDIRPFLDLVL